MMNLYQFARFGSELGLICDRIRQLGIFQVAAVLMLAPIFVGCTIEARLSETYQPKTLSELSGVVQVLTFAYEPADQLDDDQIETIGGKVHIEGRTVGEYFTDAVRLELRQAGISLTGVNECALTGAIYRIWLRREAGIDVHYRLTNTAGDELYVRRILTERELRNFEKEWPVQMNAAVASNINQVLSDPLFSAAIDNGC